MRTWGSVAALILLLGVAVADDDKGKDGKAPAGGDPAAKPQAEDDGATQDLRAGGDEKKRYFVHGPKKDAKPPKDGFSVLYVLPGGDGGPDFQSFVKNIRAQALSDDWLAVELVATKWRDDQTIVWPTAALPAKDAKFTTEEFFAAVHKDVTKNFKIDGKRVFALGWSSGGPPVYTLTLAPKSPVVGAYVAMSVFKPALLPKLDGAKGKPFFIDHSPDDKTCPFKMAEEARDALKKAGGVVDFVTYEGGHGWHGDMWARMKKGIEHLVKNAGK
jgi:predicted esterase